MRVYRQLRASAATRPDYVLREQVPASMQRRRYRNVWRHCDVIYMIAVDFSGVRPIKVNTFIDACSSLLRTLLYYDNVTILQGKPRV